MPKQLSHAETQLSKPNFPISLVLNDVKDGKNVGSIFRLADATGAKHIYLCDETPCPPHKTIRKTARSTENFVAFSHHQSCNDLITSLKSEKKTIIALELTTTSVSINDYNFAQFEEIILLVGNEEHGVEQNLLELADVCVHIPMRGHNSSMNVTMATAMALQELTRQTSS